MEGLGADIRDDSVFRSLFCVLRSEEEDGEVDERSLEEVEVRLECWRGAQGRDRGDKFKRGELVWGLSKVEVWVSSLFSRLGGVKL